MAAIAGIEVILGADSAPFRREMDKARRTLRRQAKRMVRQFDTVTAAARRTTLRVVALGAAATVALGATLGRAIIGTTARFQDMRDTLDVLSKDGTAAFKFIQREAATTQFSVEQLTSTFTQLASSGVEPTAELINTFANAAALAKDSTVALTAVTDLYARATAGGQVGLEDLNRVADQSIPIFAILRKELGLSRKELTAFGSNPTGAQAILDAFGRGIQADFGNASSARLDNLTTGFSNLGDAINTAFARIGDRFAPQLKNLTDRVSTAIADNGKAFDDFGDRIATALDKIDTNFTPLLRQTESFIGGIRDAIPPLVRAFNTVGAVLTGFYRVLDLFPTGFISGVLNLSAGLLALNVIFRPIRFIFRGFLSILGGTARGVTFFANAINSTVSGILANVSISGRLFSGAAAATTGAISRFTVSLGYLAGAAISNVKTFGLLTTAVLATRAAIASVSTLAGLVFISPFILGAATVAVVTAKLALFAVGLAAVTVALPLVAVGQGTLTERVNEYTGALSRASKEQGFFNGRVKQFFLAAGDGLGDLVQLASIGLLDAFISGFHDLARVPFDALNGTSNLFGGQDLIDTDSLFSSIRDTVIELRKNWEAIVNGPTLGSRIEGRLDAARLASLGPGILATNIPVPSPSSFGFLPPRGGAARPTSGINDVSNTFNFPAIEALGKALSSIDISFDKTAVATNASATQLNELQRRYTAVAAANKVVFETEGITLDVRQRSIKVIEAETKAIEGLLDVISGDTGFAAFRGNTSLSLDNVFEGLDAAGFEFDQVTLAAHLTADEMRELFQSTNAIAAVSKILNTEEGLTLGARRAHLAFIKDERADINAILADNTLPTEGPLQRPDRVATSLGPRGAGGQSIAEAGLFRLSETGIDLGVASRATAGQVEILVTSQRRLRIANAQLSTGVNLTTGEITDLRLEAILAQGNIDGVTAALEGIRAPTNAAKESFTSFGESFSNSLKGSFESVIRNTQDFDKAFINALRSTFISAVSDKIFGDIITPFIGSLFGSFSGASGLFGGIFSSGAPVGGITATPPGLARGGPLGAGQLAMVGEEGRELFIPNQSGQVINNGLVERLLNGEGSGGGQTNNFNVTGNVDTATLEAIDRNLPSIAARLNSFNRQAGN